MVQGEYAAMRDVQITPKKEECVSDMVQKSKDAATKDAQTRFRKEECVSDMVPRHIAVMRAVQIRYRKEEFV